MEQTVKIRSICIDTLTGIMNEMYMTDIKKPNHDKWADMGKGIWQLISALQERGFEIVMILGEPGTGKSTGMRNLPPKTNIWFNADNKNPVWVGGKQEYGRKDSPQMPYHLVPKSYQEILNHIDEVQKRGLFENEKFAILTGHTEDYRTGNGETKRRLKVLGNMATKMQLEGKLETVLYSNVQKDAGETKYVLETENDGFNTARSPMELFDPVIDNDYNFVIDKLLSY
jgi:hypothetical protein